MKSINPKKSIVDKPGFARFVKSIERFGFGDPVTPFFKASESFYKCEAKHRKAERAKILKMPKSEYYEEMAMLNNRQGLRRLQAAKKSIKKARKMYPEIEKECGLLPEREKEEILNDCDIMFKDELFEMDLDPEIITEIWTEYGKVRKVVDDTGMRGLIEYYDSKLDELIEARTDLKKGRQCASPLAWAIIIAIAIILVISVAAVINCYRKYDCHWVEELLKDVRCSVQMQTGYVTQECADRGYPGEIIELP